MDEEHDVLDWGAEDDESRQQDLSNDGAADVPHVEGDNDDVEDAVSLGDEDEEQEYYSYQQEDLNTTTAKAESVQTNTAPHSTDAGDRLSTPREAQLEDSSTQVGSSRAGSPRRTSSSGHRSPQRSLLPRVTHALPPKPIVTAVTFAHHSHPSIVEATAMSVAARATGRNESNKNKANGSSASTASATGKGKTATMAGDLDPLPRGWEAREARSGSGGTYYYNVRTNQSTWTRPTQEPSRHSRHTQPPNHMADSQPETETDPNGMSYDDRHYRPGGGADGPSASRGTNDRHHGQEDVDPRFNPHPDRAFTPSPCASPSQRTRSLSPQPLITSRGQDSKPSRAARSSRGGRNANTDADFSSSRGRDSHSGAYQDSWVANDAYQESRRTSHQHYEMSYDISMDDSRPPMPPKNGSTRGRRERDPPLRDESRIPDMPDSRTRSPPPDKRASRNDNDDEYRGRNNDRLHPLPSSQGQGDYQAKPNISVSPQFSAPPPPQRRRDRPTRFGQPSSSTSMQSSVQPPADAPQTYPPRRVEEDDPYVPDDINTHELPQKIMVREKFSRIQAAVGLLPTEEERDRPQSAQRQSFEQNRQDPSSEPPARRTRPPLPPQSAEFQGLAPRPREARDRPPRQPPNRGPSRRQQTDRDEDILARPHIQRQSPDNPPTLLSSVRYDDYNEAGQAIARRRTADFDTDGDLKSSRFKQAEEDKTERESHRRGSIDMGPPTASSAGSGSYPMQSYGQRAPRGVDRGMSSNDTSSSVNPNRPPSPVSQIGLPSSRHLDRSPPPHLRVREVDNDGVREGWARRDRGRPNEYSRGPPGAASGTNNIPIGNHRKSFGETNAGPAIPQMRSANNPISLRTARTGGGKGRGGPPREQQFDRTHDDGYARIGRVENDGPPSRQRNGSLPPFERRQPLNVDTRVPRKRVHLSTSPVENRYEPASADLAHMPRTWTPRGEAPPEAFLTNNASKEDWHSTSPLLDRASVAVEAGRPSRYHNSRDRPGSSRGPSHSDGRPPPKERFARQFDEPRRNGGLEGRLSDRFDDHAPMPVRQTHALPPNPLSYATKSPDTARRTYNPAVDKQLDEAMPSLPSQGYSSRNSADGYPDHDVDAPPHLHLNSGGEDSYIGRRWRRDNRPEMLRRPGSLLDRLDMPTDGNDFQEEPSYSRSLSDRVQVPSKRERDDTHGDRYPADDSFDGEDADPAMKRARRRTTAKAKKPRKPMV